jgi:arylsulfatase
MKEAVKYNVLPIDDWDVGRFDPVRAGRPHVMGGRTTLTLFEGMTGVMENPFINVKNRSSVITTDVESDSRPTKPPTWVSTIPLPWTKHT